MNKLILTVALIACTSFTCTSRSIAISPVVELQCPLNEYLTPSGCWNSCSAPQYSDCPQVFNKLYRPSFCAYTKSGEYQSYTHECQACNNERILAVRDGKCDCSFVKCPRGKACQDGQCVAEVEEDKCARIRCGNGYQCK
jgi:hypothetical protein